MLLTAFSHGLLSLPSYAIQDHQLRVDTLHSELGHHPSISIGLPTDLYGGGKSLNEVFFCLMTFAKMMQVSISICILIRLLRRKRFITWTNSFWPVSTKKNDDMIKMSCMCLLLA